MSDLTLDLAAILAVALLAVLWLLVQRAWRRALPEHAAADEALDVRWGSCGAGCGCAAGACRRETEGPPRGALTDPVTTSSPPTEIRR
jgi:hypothetical protein